MRININGHTNVIPGSTLNAQGHRIHAISDVRRTAAKVLKSLLFPTNGQYHKAKRRGDRATLAVA